MNAIRRVIRGENAINFTRWWNRALAVSALLMLVSVGSLVFRGLNLGIDFEGGTSWEVPAPGVTVADARSQLEEVGQGNAKIQVVGDNNLRVQSATETPETQNQVRQKIAEIAGTDVSEVSVSTVGPSWGQEISRSAIRALIIFLIVITIYLSLRLQWQMAAATLVAMLHDILISVGAYSVFQFEVTPATVIAFLTILGYSIYDTVVVFDQVKENEKKVGLTSRLTYTDMVSLSMNQVFVRSINTTVTSILPVISILVVGSYLLGAVTLQEFGIALFVGLLSGAYSSIFVAAPVLAHLREREGKFRSIRERIESSRPTDMAGAAVTGSSSGDGGARAATTSKPTTGTAAPVGPRATSIPPRPRKKGKRR
jgi:preprotein translocase subunit SecF